MAGVAGSVAAPRFVLEHATVRRVRGRLSRAYARAAFAFMIAPPATSLIALTVCALGTLGDLPDDRLLAVSVAVWPLCALGALVAMLVAHRLSLAGSGRARRIEIDGGELRLSRGEGVPPEVVSVADVESALVVDGTTPDVEIGLADGDVILVQRQLQPGGGASAEEGLLAALGFAPGERRVAVSFGGAGAHLRAGCVGAAFGWLGMIAATFALTAVSAAAFGPSAPVVLVGLFPIGLIALSYGLRRVFLPSRLVVGNDGVVHEEPHRKRFIPLASIVDLNEGEWGVSLLVRGPGRDDSSILLAEKDVARRRAAVRRIRDVLDARRPGDAGSALLGRGGRSVAEWRESLRAVTSDAGGYRGESLPVDVLLRVAESADAPIDERLGAAMAIGLADDAQAKQRLRVVAEGAAEEGTRAALAGAAEGQVDEELLEALTDRPAGARAAARRT
jgi:hypothetical protein